MAVAAAVENQFPELQCNGIYQTAMPSERRKEGWVQVPVSSRGCHVTIFGGIQLPPSPIQAKFYLKYYLGHLDQIRYMYEPFFRLLKLWRNLSLSADLETERLILLEKHACLSYNFARICKAISQPLRRHKINQNRP